MNAWFLLAVSFFIHQNLHRSVGQLIKCTIYVQGTLGQLSQRNEKQRYTGEHNYIDNNNMTRTIEMNSYIAVHEESLRSVI